MDVSKGFGGVVALSSVSLEVGAGEILGIIGPNGSGKTTLFNVVTGMLRADAGRVRLHGEELGGRRPFEICQRGIGRTFQIPRPFAHMSVLDNAMVGALFGGGQRGALAERAALTALAQVGLGDRPERPAASLTLAERKRLELARALASGPSVLLLDEVLGGLDTAEVQGIVELVLDLRSGGLAVAMIEHVLPALMQVADRVAVLAGGTLIALGAPGEVVKERSVIESYLGPRARFTMEGGQGR